MRRCLIFASAVLSLPALALGQTGVPPFASFTQSQFAAINNGDGNVIFALPIMSSPGRGLNLNLNATYNSLFWGKSAAGGAPAWYPLPPWNLQTPFGTWANRVATTYGSCGHLGSGYTQTTFLDSYLYQDPLGAYHPFNISVRQFYSSCTDTTTYSGTYSGYALDNSGYYASISDPSLGSPSFTDKSGVKIASNGLTITDTNGNYLSSNTVSGETDWTDSAGRLALKIIPSASTILYKYLDPTGAYQTTTVNLQNLPVKTNFQCTGVFEYTGTLSVVSSLVLPNNQTYAFTYEPTPGQSGYYTGRIKRVTLPTGGYYEYDYTGSNDGTSCTDGSTVGMNQVVSDGTNTATWKFSRAGGTTTVTTPQLADTPNAFDTVITFISTGQYTQQKIYKESPGVNVLRTINTTWASNGTPATRVTILEDGSTRSEVDTTYDSNGLLDSSSEYDWGSGVRGNLLRTTTYTYQTSTNYTNLNIIDRVISAQIKDGSGIVQYRQDTAYDATSGDNQSCPTGIAQHNDSSFGCTFYYRGNPTSVTTYLAPATPANGVTKNFTYDFFGNLITAQLNCCQKKTWGYSSASTTQNYSLPDSVTGGSSPGPTLRAAYTYYLPTGQVDTTSDPNGIVTTFSFDYLRRLTHTSQTGGSSISTSYDDVHFTSTTAASIDSSKSIQQITALDSLGRSSLMTTEDASNNIFSKVSVGYNLAGRAYKTSNPYTGANPSYWTTTAFDVLGHPTSVTAQDNSASTFIYSTNVTTTTDPAGNQRKSAVDGAGRVSSVWEPDPTNGNSLTLQTSYTYNVLDALTQISQGSQTRMYVYDALGRLSAATTPEAGTVCFGTVSSGSCQSNGYDPFDNLLYRTDARGVLTSYGYDALNRLTGIAYNVSGATGVPATSSVGFSYGNDSSCNSAHGTGCIGQLITMTDGVGSENYVYNGSGQLTQLQKIINGTTYNASYAYNLAGLLTAITYPSGRVVQQSVDAIGRLCEVAPSTTGCGTALSPFATGLAYTAAGQMTGFKYGNGIYASFGFSADRLQLNCLDYSTTNRGINCTHDSTTKFGLNYSYRSVGSNNGLFSGITDSVDNGRSVTYTFDALYRLTRAVTTGSANYPAWGLSETYDRYSNRSAQSIYSGCVAPMTCPTNSVSVSASTNKITGSPYAYDLSGNMTNDGVNTMVYDAENHSVSATNGGSAGAYVYDGNGLRVKKCIPNCTSPTTKTVYIFSDSKVVAEYDNGAAVGSPSREYIYAGATLLAKIDSSGTKYYHQDHISNRLVTSSSGSTLAQLGHFPYGESWYNASNDKLLFTTYERDSESGNDYAQARYNVSRLGRFASPDPIAGYLSDPQSLNRYSYVRNMPVMLVDPAGTCLPLVQNHDRDVSPPSDSVGGPSMPGDTATEPQPQVVEGCLGQYAPGLFGIGGGFSLDFGYNGDDSGFGIGSPIGGGDPWGAWQIPLKNFGWSTTTQTIDQNGDPTTVDVSTYGPLDDSFGLLLMSGGGGPNVQAQIQKGGLVANLLLSDADCAKFLKSIMTQAGYIPDLDAFKTNLNAAKFVPAPASEKPNYPDVVAQVHGGTNTVQVFQPGSSQLGQVFLHETFHTNAYDITDAGLAQYATGSHVPTPPNATNKQKQDINNKNSDIASKAFHDNCDVKKVKP